MTIKVNVCSLVVVVAAQHLQAVLVLVRVGGVGIVWVGAVPVGELPQPPVRPLPLSHALPMSACRPSPNTFREEAAFKIQWL